MKLRYSILFLVAIIASSCSQRFSVKSTDKQFIEKSEIVQKPMWAEVSIDTVKVSGTYRGKYNKTPASLEYAKEMAVANAILTKKADFLVHPMYDVTIDGSMIEVEVTGYAGRYKRFKQLTVADAEYIDQVKEFQKINNPDIQSINKKQNSITNLKKPKAGLIALAVILITGVITLGAVNAASY